MTQNEKTLAIIKDVAERHSINIRDILGDSRFRYIVNARHAAYYEVMAQRGLTYPQTGRVFGRDHSTIIHGVRKHKQRLDEAGMMVIAKTSSPAGITEGLVA